MKVNKVIDEIQRDGGNNEEIVLNKDNLKLKQQLEQLATRFNQDPDNFITINDKFGYLEVRNLQ